MAQKTDTGSEAQHGKKPNQKLKPYLVQQYLLKNTDENHVVNAYEIVDFLELCGISAERRSIYRDIDDINKVMWLIENKHDDEDGVDIAAAEEVIAADKYDAKKAVVYSRSQKGFYVTKRHYTHKDIRLMAECIYSAKFLSQSEAKRLADVVCNFVSKYQAEKIRHDALLTDRVKTANDAVIKNIDAINEAMSLRLDGEPHEPEKIRFLYLKYSIKDISKQVERRHGDRYTVSPYKLLINDGNYYLLAYDSQKQKMMTYRVDRMKDVRFTDEPREGKEAFEAIDLRAYTKRVFSMFGGDQQRVTIRFINPLLDAVVDRFGNDRNTVWYSKCDEKHFTITTQVEISDQFFGWVLGFGKRAKIMEPPAVVDKFAAYLDKVREMY